MIEQITEYETGLRLTVFAGGMAFLLLWEYLSPRRQLRIKRIRRWLKNLALVVTSTVFVRLIISTAPVAVAAHASATGTGFFNNTELPFWAEALLCFILLDLIIYLQHAMFHALPVFWRIHRVHHTDRDCDVTTGLRFHPFEILVSLWIKMAAVLILGAPAIVVIVFEVVLNFMSMFTHSNINLGHWPEKVLRYVFVTPDMHRLHHSASENETNSNFGFNFSFWDRLFGTYRKEPELGHIGMEIGLDHFQSDQSQTFGRLLAMPFAGHLSGYAINYRDLKLRNELEQATARARQNQELEEANRKLKELSRTDQLTGLANRRYFDEIFSIKLNDAVRSGSHISLVLCDVDDFKAYNDLHGHQAGDHCLRRIASRIRKSFERHGDITARYGGEEFAIVVSGSDVESTRKLCEAMRKNVEKLKLPEGETGQRPTISVGYTSQIPDQNTSTDDLIRLADKALYQAKDLGKNRVSMRSSQTLL